MTTLLSEFSYIRNHLPDNIADQEFGLQAGDYFELVCQDDQLIFLKTLKETQSNTALSQLSAEKRAEKLYKRKLARLYPVYPIFQ